MHKILKIALAVFGLIGAILWFQLPSADAPAFEAVDSTAMSLMFAITYLLLAVAVISSFIFAFKKLFSTKESVKKALFSMGGFLALVLVSYIAASGTDIDLAAMADNGNPTTEGTVKNIGMGLNMFFLLTIIAVALMVVPGIKKFFTK
jgi:magnesium-transporting ATPase (P-type)|tara:strand:+ start:573 stop:1016 length:444 start_codon:yes stop_codon:yes gene_type:complete